MKGQVTIFILLGVMVFAIVIGLLVLLSGLDVVNQEQPRDDSSASLAARECVQQGIADGVALLSQQGGAIFLDQGGSYSRADPTTYVQYFDGVENRFVYKGLRPNPRLDVPPEYPVDNIDAFIAQRTFFSLWGTKTLPLISGTPVAIAEQLQQFVELYMQRCEDRDGQPVNWGNYAIDLRINLDDISVTVSNSSVFTDQELAVRNNVRLGRMYVVAQRVIDNDRRNLTFAKLPGVIDFMEGCFTDVDFCVGDGITVTVAQSIDNEPGTDLVIVSDANSVINGTSLSFVTAVENRRPLVNFYGSPYGPPFEDADIVVAPGETLFFNPQVFDPDEDVLTAFYSGWGQDEVSFFNETRCCAAGSCTLGDATCYRSWPISSITTLMDSAEYQSGTTCPDRTCATLVVEGWMRGVHNLRVSVADGHLIDQDYQDYTIIVASPGDVLS